MDLGSIAASGLLGAAGIMTIFEVTPIKLNPWSKIAEWLGKAANKEVLEQLKDQAETLKNVKASTEDLYEKLDQKDAEDARNHILRFGDEIKNKVRHSQEYFNQILDDITKYEKYCREHPDFKNERTASTEAIIKEVYQKCIKENDFL